MLYNWTVRASIPPGDYVLRATSPISGPQANRGVSGVFKLLAPYGFVTSTWGDCVLNPGYSYCGSGKSRRNYYCADIRNYAALGLPAPAKTLTMNQTFEDPVTGLVTYGLVSVLHFKLLALLTSVD